MWPATPGRHCPNCVQQICGVELLKSLTGAEMRISIKTDPGWSLLVAKLLCCTALDTEVCNYIPLNNWNHCPPAISSSNWMFNITLFYISYILHAVSLTVVTEDTLNVTGDSVRRPQQRSQEMMMPAWSSKNCNESSYLCAPCCHTFSISC